MEHHTLESHALFVFGESGLADILPAGQDRIRAPAQSLQAYRSIDRIRIVGHTGRIGSDAFNDRQSLARAALIVCLQPDRRVTIAVTGIK
jgi:OOP family OmpA-OmpF porin